MPHAFFTESKRAQIVPVWNYYQLLASLGTSVEIVRRIKQAGYDPPSPKTVDGWRFRGRIPSQWVPMLLTWALKAGTIKSINQLLVKGKVTL